MYLIDTNIWLERLLDQQQSDIVGQLLAKLPSDQLAMTDFTLHSIALAMMRRQLGTAFEQFVQDVFIEGAVGLLSLSPTELSRVVVTMQQQQLDYDDAYQYVVAVAFQLTFVSFDKDFDGTTLGRKTPQQILQALSSL
ncbi:type II toxin-antitoxin system VapC family toxin [Leptolyngbya sp. PCC 6406]|uniref:type II toxin-antitoxin system VapC family toxin n=1 Tax=Leptolyngbya sp. PCC 6406 TaxID=1173264 RepID=UPI0002F9C801|nr:PIN domain-containing protein [Leptolyngbya sp. PCC 6406]